MNFRRYSVEIPFGALAENFVNSHDVTLDVPEHLRTPADLIGFLQEHDIVPPRRPSATELEATKRLRTEVRALFEADTQTEALERLNELLDGARVSLSVVKEKGAPRLEWTADSSMDLIDSLRSAVAVNLAHIVTVFGFERLRVCRAQPCVDVFLDVSKRGERRFCGPRCATRTRVAAHRARQA